MTCVLPVLLFGSEHWTLPADMLRRLQRVWRFFIRTILGLSPHDVISDHITDAELHLRLGVPSLLTSLQQRLGGWLGHLARLPPTCLTRLMLLGTLSCRSLPPAPTSERRTAYFSRVQGVLRLLPGIDTRIWARQAMDKLFWKTAVRNMVIAPQTRSTPAEDRVRLRPSRRIPEQNLHCPIAGCLFLARNLQGLNAHINIQHAQGRRSMWKCPHCDAEYHHKGAWTVHISRWGADASDSDHSPVQPRARNSSEHEFVCPEPLFGLSFLSLSQLNRHTRSQCLGRPGGPAVPRQGKYMQPCDLCDTWWTSSQALGIHKRRSH